ncbi:MAG: UMP kinase, partial [Oscillospiraceae bacterium]|nr:UMP kinase [Oscillospiraceae bacterium]
RDPKRFPDAKKYETVSHAEVLAKQLGVMDATAAALCRERGLPMVVFNLSAPENILRALCGEAVGTLVQ